MLLEYERLPSTLTDMISPTVFHTSSCPSLVLYQRMPLWCSLRLPSLLKTPVCTIDHSVPGQLGKGELSAWRTGPLPGSMVQLPRVPVLQYISQIISDPGVHALAAGLQRNRMSDLPSALKSPVAGICQSSGGIVPGEPPPSTCMLPFMKKEPSVSHTTSGPGVHWLAVRVQRNRMSDLPSPLKSPTPAICHCNGSTAPGVPSSTVCVWPFRSQILTEPVTLLNQRMSPKPSLLKSPVPT